MKTTIDLAEPLLARAKQIATTEGITLRELVDGGLRRALAARELPISFRFRRATFGGEGLQPAVATGLWERLSDLAYEDRGARSLWTLFGWGTPTVKIPDGRGLPII